MAITNARMQIKRGNEVDFDAEKMLVGEWALSTDKRIVRICVAPNTCIRMATYDAFEVDMAKVEKILEECQSIEDAVELINSQVSDKLDATIEYTNQAKQYRDETEQFRNEVESMVDIGIATTERAGIVKPDGETITVDADGTIHSVGTQGTIDYEELENKPKINGVELSGNNSLNDLGITTADSKDNTVTFSQADERENIITNENHATLFGKIAKWFSDLKTHAFVNPIANLLTTETGYALDATQGKALDDKIGAVKFSLYYSALTYPLENGAIYGILCKCTRIGWDYELFAPYPAIRQSEDWSVSLVVLQNVAILSTNWTDEYIAKSESGIHVRFNYPTDLSAYIGAVVDLVVTIKYSHNIYD